MSLWPSRSQWRVWSLPSKLTAIGTLLAIVSLALYSVDVLTGFMRARVRPDSRLAIGYLDFELNGKEMALLKKPIEPATSRVQRHAFVDPNLSSVFDLYGVWVKNVGDAEVHAESASVYLNFADEIAEAPGVQSCWQPFPSTEAAYGTELRCLLGTVAISPGQRRDIPWFNGTPVPSRAMKAKIRVYYGKTAAAEFTIRPPESQ